MRQILRFSLACSIAVAMASTAMAESREFDLKGFTKVQIDTGINATITLGNTFSVHAESANIDLLDKLEVTQTGDTLSAKVDQNFLDFIFNGGVVGQLLGANNLVLAITLPTLTGVSAGTAADVDVTGAKGDIEIDASSGADLVIAAAAFGAVRVNASSGSDLSLSGACTSLTAETSSGADLKAADLECASAIIDASSGGDASVFASVSIKVNASSGADVTVFGNPAEQVVESSSGGDVTIED